MISALIRPGGQRSRLQNSTKDVNQVQKVERRGLRTIRTSRKPESNKEANPGANPQGSSPRDGSTAVLGRDRQISGNTVKSERGLGGSENNEGPWKQ